MDELPLTEVETWSSGSIELTFIPPDEWVIVRDLPEFGTRRKIRLDTFFDVIDHLTIRELEDLGLPPLVILALQAE